VRAALWAEWIKTRRALVPRVVVAALVLGPLGLGAGLLAGAGNPAVAAQVAPFATGDPWRDLATLAAVVVSAGGLLGFGMLLAWSFGREFADRTVGGLFAAPVGLPAVAAAKLLVHAVVVAAVALLLGLGMLPVGLALGLPAPRAEDLTHVGRTVVAAALTGLGAMPCAWVATLTRGMLAPIGVAVALLVSAEIAILTGAGAWYPFAAPGTWAGLAGTASDLAATPIQLALVPVTAAVFAMLTLRAWARLRL
jgi:ABC-2 type transport system permease protein